MIYIGAHVGGGVAGCPKNAHKIGATACALFTRNPKSWQTKPLDEHTVMVFRDELEKFGIDLQQVMPHASYLINVGCPKEDVREKSVAALYDELLYADRLGVRGVNFHPGAHLKQISEEACFDNIAAGMNNAIEKTERALLIIECTAGQGSHVGWKFEQIAAIIERVTQQDRVGVCLDTCHLFAAGYAVHTPEGWADTMAQFERIIGIEKLQGIHLNDSKGEFDSHLDRHHSIGAGNIGAEAFRHIMRDKRLHDMPLILETIDPELWEEEIILLRNMALDENSK